MYYRATITVEPYFTTAMKQFPVHMKAAMHEALKWWHHMILPLHFTQAAWYRYPGIYTPRTSGYTKAKIKYKHHNNPLVWSGDMQRAALGMMQDRSTATKTKATARASFLAPRANLVGLRKGGIPSPVNKVEELKATNSQEMEYFQTLIMRHLDQALEQFAKRGASKYVAWQISKAA